MTPRTVAGRALLDWYAPPDNEHDRERERMGADILAIEAQAAAPDALTGWERERADFQSRLAAAPDALGEARRYGSVAMPDGSVLGPLAAPAVPAAIDPERLARAMRTIDLEETGAWGYYALATAIAAAYAEQ